MFKFIKKIFWVFKKPKTTKSDKIKRTPIHPLIVSFCAECGRPCKKDYQTHKYYCTHCNRTWI